MTAIPQAETRLTHCSPVDTGAVTVAFVRRVRAGHEGEYERRLNDLHVRLRDVPGYLGVNVVHDDDLHEYTSIVRFDSLASLKAWEASGMHGRWEADLEAIVEGPAEVRRAEGLEFWFVTAHHGVGQAPSRHKMAVVLVAVVTLLALVIGPLLTQTLGHAPRIVRAFVGATLQVLLLTYVIMPRMTRLLARWLYTARA
jgi:antibiotic biosynthesis monooxygenase (ABM) superfamily enzyme